LPAPVDTVASHRAAAVLHGVREGEVVEVTVRRGANRQRALAHQAQVPRGDRTTIDGIPVTRIERTLDVLALVVKDDDVEQAVEAALRRGLTTADRLVAQLGPGRPGTARLRRVLERRAAGRPAGSELEVRLIQLLRAAGMPDPVRQYELRVRGERYFLDFPYPDRRLCIEVDGREAHGVEAFQRDRTRQNALVLAGWTVLRFTWADVTERPDHVLALVAQALVAQALVAA
jgi:very-short-patch-repair endonuclease